VEADGLDGVVRAGGIVPTTAVAAVGETEHGGKDDLIAADEQDEDLFHDAAGDGSAAMAPG
jgi:hypothetical protein